MTAEPDRTVALAPARARATRDAPCTAGENGGPCARCRGLNGAADGVPFEPGNQAAVRHGAYSKLALQSRARALRDELAALVPFGTEADEPLVDLLALTLAQCERAGIVLAREQAESHLAVSLGEQPSPRLDRLAADARAWVKTAAKLLDQLGLTPRSRAALADDLAAAAHSAALARVAEEGRAIRERREAAGV